MVESTARAAVGVPEGFLKIPVLGLELAVTRQGRGNPLVCLHAVAHGARDFEPLVERVGHRFEVIRIDWPGHGRSGSDNEPASAARYAQLLEILLDRLQISAPVIIGNSIGGAAALLYATRRPVRALVLCDTGGLVPHSAAIRRICRLFAAFFRAGTRGAWWFPSAYRAYYRWLVLPSPAAGAQRERIIACGSELAAVLVQAWESFGREAADIRKYALRLQAPTWFAWARGDRIIPLSYNLPCITAMKNARLTTFPGGHAPFLEQPDDFVEQLLAFESALPREASIADESGDSAVA